MDSKLINIKWTFPDTYEPVVERAQVSKDSEHIPAKIKALLECP